MSCRHWEKDKTVYKPGGLCSRCTKKVEKDKKQKEKWRLEDERNRIAEEARQRQRAEDYEEDKRYIRAARITGDERYLDEIKRIARARKR